MTLIGDILNIIKPNSINRSKARNKAPKYFSDIDWIQDSSQSTTTSDGRYDLKHFSKHETDTINHIVRKIPSGTSLNGICKWKLFCYL